jgi:hypothetical protein
MRFILIHGRTVKGKLGFSRGKYASQRRPGGRHAPPRFGIPSLLFQFRFNSGIKTAARQWQGEVAKVKEVLCHCEEALWADAAIPENNEIASLRSQ